MTEEKPAEAQGQSAEDIVAAADTGARNPAGATGKALLLVALAWSLFQLWYASPLPFILRFGILNSTEARSIHLAFAVFLSFTAFPALMESARGKFHLFGWFYVVAAVASAVYAFVEYSGGREDMALIFGVATIVLLFAAASALRVSPVDRVPLADWVLALVAAFAAGYLFLFYRELADRPGLPTTMDLVTAVAGMILLLEATRRALGPPLMVVALVFLFYVFGGPIMPDVLAHKGASLAKAMSHQWLYTEGVFGVALGVSTSFVFLFVLFGALLDKAGAGNYFIKVAFSLLGHLRGGPAKAAVVASGLSGIVSGSSIANVVTTGTFTIPLMKRVGFPAEKAGAVEVAASTNGQLTPPIMGAAAFLMVEYVGISYIEVMQHAVLPALISYIALLYIVHLEALKADMRGLDKPVMRTRTQALISFGITVSSIILLSAAVYYGLGWIKVAFGAAATWIIGVLVFAVYVGLIWFAARYPELEMDDPDAPIVTLPEAGPTAKSGLHFILPVVVLVWCLMVERLSPGLSAFYATVFMILIVVTQRPLFAMFRRRSVAPAWGVGLNDLFEGLVTGARNMIGIGVATAAAGIIVGTVTLTGIGLVMTEFVEFISAGNIMLMLGFVAIISLILGMGLPTTANYIVVSTLMAPVVVALGAESGLIVPLIAVHMFVFYFGILADDTPPVGLAAFAAAAIARSDPIKTGIQGFTYDIRTAILPFMFIFNTKLLLIGIEGPVDLVVTVASALAAMLIFAAATQGYLIVRTRIYETLALLLITFTLFRPGFFMDQIYPPLETVDPTGILQLVEGQDEGGQLRLKVEGIDIEDNAVSRTVILPLGPAGSGAERLDFAGLEVRAEDGKVFVDNLVFGGPAEKAGIDFDFEITEILVKADRPPKELMFIPALLLLGLVIMLQRARRPKAGDAPAAA